MEKLPDKDFIRCKKCNKPINKAMIDFNLYNLPRFVDQCKDCEFQDRKLLEKPKEDLINSIKIAETFYKFSEGKLQDLEIRFAEFQRTLKTDLQTQHKQIAHDHYTLNNRLSSLEDNWNKKYVNLEDYKNNDKVISETLEDHECRLSYFTEFLEKFSKSKNPEFIDFSKFPSALQSVLKNRCIFLISQLKDIASRTIYVDRLGNRSLSKIKDYLKELDKNKKERR